MPNSTTMTYNGQDLVPVPLVTFNKQPIRAADGQVLSNLFTITLEGTLLPAATGNSSSIIEVDANQDRILEIFKDEGKELTVECGGTELIKCFPRVNRIFFPRSSDNWSQSSDYTIELEFNDFPPSGAGNFVSDLSESWTLEPIEDKPYWTLTLPGGTTDSAPYLFRLTHEVSAVGQRVYDQHGLVKQAWEQARFEVVSRLGYDSSVVQSSGVINLNVAQFDTFNHVRVQNLNEVAGSFSVTETFIVFGTGSDGTVGNVIEDFTVDIRQELQTANTIVSINGTVQGLETRDYGNNPGDFSITETKFAAASGAFDVVKNRIYDRCRLFSEDVTQRTLNPQILNSSIGYSPPNGVINYTYSFDDRPPNYLEGALYENIIIRDINPVHTFSTLFVLGRSQGPILQDLSSQTLWTRELTVEAIFPTPTGNMSSAANFATLIAQNPHDDVDILVESVETNLEGAYPQVFRSADQEQWQPKNGSYSRNISWAIGLCTN